VAEDLAQDRPLVAQRQVTRSERARRTAYRYRFGIIYFCLAAVVGASVGAFIVIVGKPKPAPQAAWSSFEPTGSALARVTEIADQIPRAYQLKDGGQLVDAAGGIPQVTVPNQGKIDVSAIVVRPDPSRGKNEKGGVFNADSTIAYTLCGRGTGCTIGSGTPSTKRLQLVRREALELALYTFKYVDGTDSIVVFLPTAPPTTAGTQPKSTGALFLRRKDLGDVLDRPLSRSLTPRRSVSVGDLSPSEAAMVDRLTVSHVFPYQYAPSPADGSPILVLGQTSSSG